jgi:hypothetical protein
VLREVPARPIAAKLVWKIKDRCASGTPSDTISWNGVGKLTVTA